MRHNPFAMNYELSAINYFFEPRSSNLDPRPPRLWQCTMRTNVPKVVFLNNRCAFVKKQDLTPNEIFLPRPPFLAPRTSFLAQVVLQGCPPLTCSPICRCFLCQDTRPDPVLYCSCLMFAMTDKGRPVHICCAPKEEYLAIITAYVPSLGKWEPDFKTRRKK